MRMKNICVFASSSSAVDPVFTCAARGLGVTIAKLGCTLIYGGAHVGLMKVLALAVQQNGGKVVGVLPKQIHEKGFGYEGANELIVTEDLRERKAVMEQRADCFVALPGGFGTLDEMFEFLTLKQLQFHNKPVVFLNINGFYDPLAQFFWNLYEKRFANPESHILYCFAPDVEGVFEYLDSYEPKEFRDKWFEE